MGAVAIVIKNILGLVCNPIAGLIEVPCAKRNITGAVSALTTSGGDLDFQLELYFF